MKIKKFIARRVHDQYNFHFDFFPDITFLVGINGSGKTSALKLMQAALSADLAALSEVKFNYLYLETERESKRHTLEITNEGKTLAFRLDGKESENKVRLLGDEEREIYTKSGRLNDFMEDQRIKFLNSGGQFAHRFFNSERPLFLGLERRMGRYDDEVYFEEDTLRGYRPPRMRRDALEGLDSCRELIERAYRNFRKLSDSNNSRLINVIVESTFDYLEFDSSFFPPGPYSLYGDLQGLVQRRQEIESFATALGGGDKAKSQIEAFFSKLEKEVDKHDGRGATSEISAEWLINRAQILRIHKILAEMDRQKKNAEKMYTPIKEFTKSINEFFAHSRKNLEINAVGRINVFQAGAAIPLHSLSSGEKQLLILLIHARFGRNRGAAFIVDEPELSLHLGWQEMLVEALLKSNKNNQFIFATHSPEIVGLHKDNCIQVG